MLPKEGVSKVSIKTKQEMDVAQSKTRKDKWKWVEQTIWTKEMLTALDNGVKGNKWYSLIDKIYNPKTLEKAWQSVMKNKGAAGIDDITIKKFTQNKDKYLKEINRDLRKCEYKPSAIRRVNIPKGDGKTRPLGIPTIKDRIVQSAIKMAIEPIWEKEFIPTSYGFRPGKNAHEAIKEVSKYLEEGYMWVIDADIKGYFDNISHERLIKKVKDKIADGRVLNIIEKFLKARIIEDIKEWTPIKGTPQGGVLSPLLANIYLHSLDLLINSQDSKIIRYADDFVILCRSEEQAKQVKRIIEIWMMENELELQPDKTKICMYNNDSFEFLGYRFEGKYKFVRKKSIDKLKEKIRELTKRTCGKNICKIILEVNRILVGWFNYFKYAQGEIHRKMDELIRRRLRAIIRKQKKRPGMGKTLEDHKQWPNVYFAKLGLFSLKEARDKFYKASQSR